MLTLVRQFLRRNSRTQSESTGSATAKPAIVSSAKTAPAADQLALTGQSQERNPFEGVAPGFNSVKIDSWGQGPNGSIEQILHNQGYTSKEIYSKGENGKTLLDEVSRVNNLRDPNLIQAGQDLMVPSKQAPEQAEQHQQQPAQPPQTTEPTQPTPPVQPQQPEAAGEEKEAAVNSVKVDRYGKGPNGSLDAILRNQGFKPEDIYKQDANGDSLLKKVARANGIDDPNKIQAGDTLQVPNSMDALGQMDIPEMPAPQEQAPVEKPPVEQPPVEQPPEEKPPVEQAPVEKPPVEQPPVAEEERPEVRPPVTNDNDNESEVTANMGMLLSGADDGKFTKQEFQYLNARSSRYAQMRARFSTDGYSNSELEQLGKMEQRYGVEFARLAASDDVQLPTFPATSNDRDKSVMIRHYHESGPLYDRYKNGTTNSEDALRIMTRQRAEARQEEIQ